MSRESEISIELPLDANAAQVLLKTVQKQYPLFHIKTIEAGENERIFIAHTSHTPLELRLWEDVEKLKQSAEAREVLILGRFRLFDRFIPTVSGKRFHLMRQGRTQVGMTLSDPAFTADESGFNPVLAGESLAKMHLAMREEAPGYLNSNYPRWQEKFQLHLDHFIQARKAIERNVAKSKAEHLLLSNFQALMHRGRKVLKLLQEVQYEAIVSEAEQKRIWGCGNVRVSSFHILDDTCFIRGMLAGVNDLQQFDIASLLMDCARQQLAEEDIASFIRAYEEVLPLSAADLKIIYAYTLFPHFVWRKVYENYILENEMSESGLGEEETFNGLFQSFEDQQKVEQFIPMLADMIHDAQDSVLD